MTSSLTIYTNLYKLEVYLMPSLVHLILTRKLYECVGLGSPSLQSSEPVSLLFNSDFVFHYHFYCVGFFLFLFIYSSLFYFCSFSFSCYVVPFLLLCSLVFTFSYIIFSFVLILSFSAFSLSSFSLFFLPDILHTKTIR